MQNKDMKKENINKENFFNEMMEKCPESTQKLLTWLDNYQDEIVWSNLFYHNGETGIEFTDLPYEMQKGILERFVKEEAKTDIISFTPEGFISEVVKALYKIQDKINQKQT